jgi:TPP-dependent pyruvate/acetoin dehydrogenase alpha subunit
MTISSIDQEVTGPASASEKNGFSLISDSKLLALYAAMVKCRMIAERAALLRRRGEVREEIAAPMGSCSPTLSEPSFLEGSGRNGAPTFASTNSVGVGHEAAMAGVAVDLLPEDTLSLSSGSLVAGFVKGRPLEKLIASLGTTNNGQHSAGEQSGNGIGDGITTARTAEEQVRAVCDVALGNKLAGNGDVAVAFCAGWPEEISAWCKALRDAGKRKLPILFVVYKDAEAVGEGDGAQGETSDVALGLFACGIPTITVDGNDVVAVYRVAFEALARARRGCGGTLIECVSTRIGGADGMKNGQRKIYDPILMMQTYLERKGLFNAEAAREMATGFSRELEAATRSSTS